MERIQIVREAFEKARAVQVMSNIDVEDVSGDKAFSLEASMSVLLSYLLEAQEIYERGHEKFKDCTIKVKEIYVKRDKLLTNLRNMIQVSNQMDQNAKERISQAEDLTGKGIKFIRLLMHSDKHNAPDKHKSI